MPIILKPVRKREEVTAVSANERRNEIMRIMVGRRQETMQNLAAELGVTDRTIRTDIMVLTAEYPLETVRGNGGGVKLADWYYPHKNLLSREQIKVLGDLTNVADEQQKSVLLGILRAYGSNQYRFLTNN